MDFSNYIFRSHMVGKIINVPKPLSKTDLSILDRIYTKQEKNLPLTAVQLKDWHRLEAKKEDSKLYRLSDSQKKLLSELAFAETHGRRVELNSPQISKGLLVEKEARDLLSRVTGLFLIAKKERKSNKWVTGEIDVEPNNVIPDIKASYSWESYSHLIQEKPNEIYLRQGDSYMDLWGLKDFLLCHILVDTPEKLVDSEIRKLDYKSDVLNYEGDVLEDKIDLVKQTITNHIFSRKALEEYCNNSATIHIEWFDDFNEIPEEKRVHMIPHSYDKVRIEQRNECIKISREFMNTVQPINNFNKQLIA